MAENYGEILQKFKSAVVGENNTIAEKLLGEIKKIMLELDSLPPLSMDTPNAASELNFARESLEYAVILSVNMGDKESFQRHMSSLRPYYTTNTIDSDIKFTVLGLNLLYLLVENRLADFHCELELLSESQQQHAAITFCTQLDKHLVVGSYDQVLESAAHPPVKYYSFFLKSLLETVRLNIGECVIAAYTSLTLASATSILMFHNEEETKEFITDFYPDWRVSGNAGEEKIDLLGSKAVKSDEIPSLKLISQSLAYATELERIV